MSWIDYIIGGVLLLAAFVFALTGRDGSGAAIFRAIGLVVATWSAHQFHVRLASGLGLSPMLTYILLFVIVAFLLLMAGVQINNILPLDISPFNGIIRFLFGIVGGWALCYAMLEVMTTAVVHNSSVGQAVTTSVLAPEILEFRTFTSGKTRLDSTTFKTRDPWEQPPAHRQK